MIRLMCIEFVYIYVDGCALSIHDDRSAAILAQAEIDQAAYSCLFFFGLNWISCTISRTLVAQARVITVRRLVRMITAGMINAQRIRMEFKMAPRDPQVSQGSKVWW